MARKGILPRRKRGRTTLGTHTNPYMGGTTIISSTTSHLLDNTGSNQHGHDLHARHYDATISMAAAAAAAAASTNHHHHHHHHRSRSLSPTEPPFHFANFKLPEMKPKMLQ